jgi:hypothetical protein
VSQQNSPSSVPNVTDIERARHLIPGFLKKTLSADDQGWMTQFLETLTLHGGTTAQDFDQEIAWVQRSQEQLAQAAPAFDAQAGWQRMQGRLDAPSVRQPAPHASPKPSVAAWVKTQINRRLDNVAAWWRKPMVGVLASAMIVAQMGLLAAVVKQMNQVQNVSESVSPASGAPSLEGMSVLTIVFKDSASLLDVRTLIDSVEGRVIDGPGALGVWLVAVPKDKRDASLKRLSTAKAVESVAPQ